MKRINKIEIENYRAFIDNYKIDLPTGENLLVYGENGSGKSSLFKALNNYLSSSRDASVPFTKNNYSTAPDGEIKISFQDFDDLTSLPVAGTGQILNFGSSASNHNVQFVMDAELIKGFLDYKSLLDVYNHKEPRPNLFELIVLNLLSEHIPIGSNFRFGEKWRRLQIKLISKSYTRNDIFHREALAELPIYQNFLTQTLNDVFIGLNQMLLRYFPNLNIELGYILKDIVFNYGNNWGSKSGWNTTADLRLQVKKDGTVIQGDYRDILNEARMSAFAVCLYLAALKRNPTNFDLKILFLDDVFVGLDTGNRLPILNILMNEFPNHQIFIATYDRHWFELAQRFFKSNMPNRWQSYEFYTTRHNHNGLDFDKPLVISQKDNYLKAIQYLHHSSQPDYPAAANYFRKYTEELLLQHLPPYETRLVKDDSQIKSYKLGLLVNAGLHFLYKIGADISLMNKLKNSLPTLLHPLSHYDLSAPIYKAELIDVQNCIKELEAYLVSLKDSYRLFLTPGHMVKLNFTISSTETGHYSIYPKEAIYILKAVGGLHSLSDGHCHCKSSFLIVNSVEQPGSSYKNNDKKYQYSSVSNAYDSIHNFLLTQAAYSHIAKQPNYATEFAANKGTGMEPLDVLIQNFIW
ncbi:MAG: AAA family ATPase [Prolixibacteraceae bacterium]